MADLSVTIKNGKGYDSPWEVFKGENLESIKRDIIDWFALPEGSDELPGHEVMLLADRVAQGEHVAATVLGATPVKVEKKKAKADEPEPTNEDSPHAALIESFEEATTVNELKKLWADNKDAFDSSPEVQAAWKARGKAIQEAEKGK